MEHNALLPAVTHILVHAQLATQVPTVKITTHAAALLVRTVALQLQTVKHVLAHAHAVTQEPTVRLTQAHARTIHA